MVQFKVIYKQNDDKHAKIILLRAEKESTKKKELGQMREKEKLTLTHAERESERERERGSE